MLSLDGFRFYGCSLLLIYDGDKDAQEHFAKHARPQTKGGNRLGVLEEEDEWVEIRHRPSRSRAPDPDEVMHEKSRARRSKSVEISGSTSRHRRSSSNQRQRDHAASGTAAGTGGRRLRGEVNIRVVDFAHTTTGLDFIPFPPDHVDPPEKTLGKGYESQIDPGTGLNMARFPPKHPHQPDMGFIYGLQSVCAALSGVWREEVGEEVVRDWMGGMENGNVFEQAFPGGVEDGEVST
jgi:inositol-hexakisphosphate kinase